MKTVNGKEIDNYYNRFDAEKNYKRILLRDGYVTQASEINELQDILIDDRKRLTDKIFSDGDVASGGTIVVNAESGEVTAQAGEVYLNGRMWSVPEKTFSIPVEGTFAIGVYLSTETVSEVEDPSLRNPAVGSRGEGLPGAWREKITASWGYSQDGGEGDFFPVYTVDNGVVRAKETPPSYDSVSLAIAQYDQDSTGTGTYISSGLVVRDLGDAENGDQLYTVTAGRYRVAGMGLEFQQDQRVIYNAQPAADEIISVPTETVASTGADTQHVEFAHSPCWLASPKSVSIPRRATITLEHALVSGGSDTLEPGSVIKIISVTQNDGDTVYTEGTDFTRVGDTISWNLSGAEPSPGATYQVVYDYYATEQMQNVDYDGFDVIGASEGYSIIYNYSYVLPRVDRLCLDGLGRFQWVKGIASSSPKVPSVPGSLLAIATVNQNWRGAAGRVVNSNGVRSILFDDMINMQEQLDRLTLEVARTRLEADMSTREAGARVGMVVDPFIDNSMRDEGVTQTAAIIDSWLTLPISAEVHNLTALESPQVLPSTLSVALQQTSRSASMKINPYLVFNPLPAEMSILPSVDRWSEAKTLYDTETKYFYKNRTVSTTTSSRKNAGTFISTSTSTSTSTATTYSTGKASYLRQINVTYSIDGFGKGEILSKLTFDGVDLTPDGVVADDDGHISGTFTIPANIPTGTKAVVAEGKGGSIGTASFTGEGTINYTTLKTIKNVTVTTTTTTRRFVNVDPLAQTFILEEDTQLTAVDLMFTAKGNSNVKIRIVETSNGYPTQTVLAEGTISAAQISLTDFTRIFFDDYYKAVTLSAGVEYALVVMTDDATTAVAVATLGEYDKINQRWITSQPYTVGVLFSSSNASAWTTHQNSDLCFRLIESKTSTGTKTVSLGSVADLNGVTDLILRGSTETPSGTNVKFILTLPDSSQITLDEGQAVDLGGAVNGTISASAQLTSNNKLTPGLAPEVQIVTGTVATEATYITRTATALNATQASVVFDAIIPSGASVTAELRKDNGEYEPMTYVDAINQGDGIFEYHYTTDLSDNDTVKLRLTLSGTPSARPFVTNLRMITTK